MIKGLSDSVRVSWDGKIRSGYKQDGTGNPVNTPHFLLHDAPGLADTLGEKPTEYYGTFLYDDPEAVMKMDLRWYKKASLVCQGNGESAAYYDLGDVPGVSAKQAVFTERNFLGQVTTREIPRSRSRVCRYKSCPDYESKKCRSHLFLSMVIPQHSMASIFTLESVSEYTINSVLAEKERAIRNNNLIGKSLKISGEIFRVYKSKESVPFLDISKGKKYESEKDVVLVEWVPFDQYAAKFKEKIKEVDWNYLVAIRSAGLRLPGQEFVDAVAQLQLTGSDASISITDQSVSVSGSPLHQQVTDPEAAKKAEEEALKAKANHENVILLFEKLSALVGKENTESARLATAKNFATAAQLIDYLTKRVKDAEKKNKEAADATAKAAAVTEEPRKAADPVVLPKEGEAHKVNLFA